MSIDIPAHARTFAIWAHDEQQYGDQPYVVHLDEVVALLREFGVTDDDSIAAGFLHDVLEDSKLTRYDDLGVFSSTTRKAMIFCTDAEGHNRKTRKEATYERCRQEINQWLAHAREPELFPDPMTWLPTAVRVKVADRLANIRNCIANKPDLLSMYRKERFSFRDAMYVAGMCDDMWSEYNRLLAGA